MQVDEAHWLEKGCFPCCAGMFFASRISRDLRIDGNLTRIIFLLGWRIRGHSGGGEASLLSLSPQLIAHIETPVK